MTFAGLSNPQARANVMAFLNTKSDSPQPLPAAPAQAAAKPGSQTASKEPVPTEQQTGANAKNVGGEGASKLTDPASAKKP
jgi:cytochrome c